MCGIREVTDEVLMERIRRRFWPKVVVGAQNECWLWTGTCDPGGYGRFWLARKSAIAHRVSWMLCHGNPSPDIHVLHDCDTPPCVNPAHLHLGSHSDNMLEKARRGRRGHQPSYGRTTPAMVTAIQRALPNTAIRQIARDLGVDAKTIRYWRDRL